MQQASVCFVPIDTDLGSVADLPTCRFADLTRSSPPDGKTNIGGERQKLTPTG